MGAMVKDKHAQRNCRPCDMQRQDVGKAIFRSIQKAALPRQADGTEARLQDQIANA